jgi:hypothetical protein
LLDAVSPVKGSLDGVPFNGPPIVQQRVLRTIAGLSSLAETTGGDLRHAPRIAIDSGWAGDQGILAR